MTNEVRDLLQNPFVLRAAWEKLQDFYSTCEGGPRLEVQRWKQAPWHHLTELSRKLIHEPDKITESSFQRLPYPKRGEEILRPYCSPTVEAQVANLVFLVLLAPFLESQMECFSFGSRLYRPLRRDLSNSSDGYWRSGPFSLSDSRLFTSFRRGYGLFRRVAHWVTSEWLGSPQSYPDKAVVTKEDYPADTLPYVGSVYPLETCPPDTTALGFSKLDLKKAYPSAKLELARSGMVRMLEINPTNIDDLLPRPQWSEPTHLSEPWRLLATRPDLRLELVDQWFGLLTSSKTSWQAYLETVDGIKEAAVNYDDSGLCTGLAVSPVLLNVVLNDLDRKVKESWNGKPASFAYLRFADDIILIWPHREDKTGELPPQTVKRLLDELYNGSLALNVEKIEPLWVRELLDSGIKKAPDISSTLTLITKANRREFLTHLVEKMSRLHPETLSSLVGNDFFSRLRELSELILLDITDSEVRPDTRMAYAANRLSRTAISWQQLSAEDHNRVVSSLRETIGTAIRKNPDKFSLWRSAVRVAMIPTKAHRWPYSLGLDWLKILAGYLADSEKNPSTRGVEDTWQTKWPEDATPTEKISKEPQPHRDVLQRAKSSFVRAQLLRELAVLVTELEETEEVHYRRTPMKWHSRLLASKDLPKSVKGLRPLVQTLVKTLYPQPDKPKAPWETEAMVELLFSFRRAREIFTTPRGSKSLIFDVVASLNDTDWSFFVVHLDTVSARAYLNSWIQNESQVEEGRTPYCTLETLLGRLARQGYSNESFLFLEQFITVHAKNLRAVPQPFWLELKCQVWQLLEVYKSLRDAHLRYPESGELEDFLFIAYRALQQSLPKIWDDGSGGVTKVPEVDRSQAEERDVELKRLLWSLPDSGSCRHWSPAPSRCPALGLPRLSCLHLFQHFLSPNCEQPFGEPVVSAGTAEALASFRIYQFYSGPTPSLGSKEDENFCSFLPAYRYFPHPLVLIGEVISSDQKIRRWWAASCAYFLAITGDESCLEAIWSSFPFGIAPSDKISLQSQTLASDDAWSVIDAAFNRKNPKSGARQVDSSLRNLLDSSPEQLVQVDEFIDLKFRESGVKGALAFTETSLSSDLPKDHLNVRLAQIDKTPPWTSWKDVLDGDFELHLPVIRALEKSLPEPAPSGDKTDLLLVPEITIPEQFFSPFKAELASRTLSVIGGLYWQKLPIVKAIRGLRPEVTLVINQALVHLDFSRRPRDGFTFTFKLAKPNPAHSEYGLAKYLSQKDSPNRFFFARGYEWYRFCHREWGPFTVAICSDLLDAAPWAKMKGRLLHLFLVAFNQDVSLYDSATWTRAYELYVNLAAVNHGVHGGSLAWSPQHRNEKTIVRLEGANQFLLADVELPIRELIEAQKNGHELADRKAHESIEKHWFKPKQKGYRFKSIPPGWKHDW